MKKRKKKLYNPQTKLIFYTAEMLFYFPENQESFPLQSPGEFHERVQHFSFYLHLQGQLCFILTQKSSWKKKKNSSQITSVMEKKKKKNCHANSLFWVRSVLLMREM